MRELVARDCDPDPFSGASSQTRALVHGDDFVVATPEPVIGRVTRVFGTRKARAFQGKEADDDEDIVILGTARWVGDSMDLRADAKHGKPIREEFGIMPASTRMVSLAVRRESVRRGRELGEVGTTARHAGRAEGHEDIGGRGRGENVMGACVDPD